MDVSVQELLALEGRLSDEAHWPVQHPEARELFAAVRFSRLAVWTPELRNSWRQDLLDAQAEGRNLFDEKHIYMLEQTAPEEYAAMKDTLPAPSLEKLWLTDWICQAQSIWREKLAEKYPGLMQNSRAAYRSAGGRKDGTFEIVLRGELMTCSVSTLRLYASQVEQAQKAGRNLSEDIWERTVRRLGYQSLESAEESLLRKAE